MTTKVFDAFNGANGTDLSAHIPDIDIVGGGWSDTGANTVELDGSGALKFSGINFTGWISAGTSDQWCVSEFNALGVDNRVSLVLRRDSALFGSENGYKFNFRPADTGTELKIIKVISGSSTIIATGSFAASTSTTYSLEPEAEGTSLDFLIDGTSELSLTDSSITVGDYAGLLHEKYTSGGGKFYDFKIDDAAPSVGATIPVFMNHYRNQGIS